MDKRLPTALAIVITSIWALSWFLDIVVPAYDPHPTVHAVMMAVVGAVFGGNLLKRGSKDEDEDE